MWTCSVVDFFFFHFSHFKFEFEFKKENEKEKRKKNACVHWNLRDIQQMIRLTFWMIHEMPFENENKKKR